MICSQSNADSEEINLCCELIIEKLYGNWRHIQILFIFYFARFLATPLLYYSIIYQTNTFLRV